MLNFEETSLTSNNKKRGGGEIGYVKPKDKQFSIFRLYLKNLKYRKNHKILFITQVKQNVTKLTFILTFGSKVAPKWQF